jgi:hypothetical protein
VRFRDRCLSRFTVMKTMPARRQRPPYLVIDKGRTAVMIAARDSFVGARTDRAAWASQ